MNNFQKGLLFILKGLVNIKKIFILAALLLLTAGCAETSEVIKNNALEDIKKAEIITMDASENSLKGRIDISADTSTCVSDTDFCAVKTDHFDKSSKTIEYTVYSGRQELFHTAAADPTYISDRSFDMHAVYENENTAGYIQSDVLRGNDSYIIYDSDGEKYAFCYTDENPQYKIISFDDELLYTLDVSNPFENKFDMSLKRMRPDSEFDISAVALAFIINTDLNNEYFEEELKQRG